MWLATNVNDTLKLVNLGPGPRQVYVAQSVDDDSLGEWQVLIDYGPDQEPDVMAVAVGEQDGWDLIRLLHESLLKSGTCVGVLGWT